MSVEQLVNNVVVGAVLIGFALLGHTLSYADEELDAVSSSAIEKALEPALTRGIRVQVKQKVDLNIPFEINSSSLKPEAQAQLAQLETALRKESLAGFRFLIAGHTDASGSADYNRRLSQARAETVKRFLVDRGIDSDRLEITGSGEDELLLPDKPTDGRNRRVEIRNLGQRP